jgi:hypothetical protein
MPRPVDDLVGRRFGRLVVEAFAYRDSRSVSHWSCRCDCKNQTTCRMDALKQGDSQSCGCLRRGAIHRRRKQSSIEISLAALTYRVDRLERATTPQPIENE